MTSTANIQSLQKRVGVQASAVTFADQATCESLLNLVFRDAPATVLCPYGAGKLDAGVLEHSRGTHPHAAERGAMISNPQYTEPGMFVLQQ